MATTATGTLSEEVPAVGIAPAAAATPTQRRWQIIALQIRAGGEPCFGTEKRHYCGEQSRCEFRVDCLAMRASWRR